MERAKQEALEYIGQRSDLLFDMSDRIWEHPEVGFTENYAARLFSETLEKEGFTVEQGVGDIPTSVVGTFGSGGPVIGFLGEFDALPGLSQEAGLAEKKPLVKEGPGHGCGHNLLGTGAFAAALGLKHYLEANHRPGTVKFFACPAEEGGSGKGFMARAGVFNGMDAAFCWHPGTVNSAATESTMANYQVCYHFYGTSSHAAMSPELGRSALDALELMNNGVQYLREHIPTNTRVHYAITNAGGNAPGIVQAYAEGLYLMRAPQLPQVKELYERDEPPLPQGAGHDDRHPGGDRVHQGLLQHGVEHGAAEADAEKHGAAAPGAVRRGRPGLCPRPSGHEPGGALLL